MCATLTSGYEELEHTADLQLRVWGAELPTLYEQAARGLQSLLRLHLVADPAPVLAPLALSATDAEALLVAWLNELLYIQEARRARFTHYALRLTAEGLAADLVGETGWAARRDIKAATYHALAITRRPSGIYEAVITFDV